MRPEISMSRHDDITSMGQMLDHAREAVQMAEGFSRTNLDSDRKLELSLTRLVEIVGEAAKRVSPNRRAALPRIPWKEIVGMRNRLTHGYDAVDLDILWNVIQDDLPPLIDQLQIIINAK